MVPEVYACIGKIDFPLDIKFQIHIFVDYTLKYSISFRGIQFHRASKITLELNIYSHLGIKGVVSAPLKSGRHDPLIPR